jgi:hypothetical protein
MDIRPVASFRSAVLPASISLLLLLTACNDKAQPAATPAPAPATDASATPAQSAAEPRRGEEYRARGMETGRDAHARGADMSRHDDRMAMDHDMPTRDDARADDARSARDPAQDESLPER